MNIYLSSTFIDLQRHRAILGRILRKPGYDVAMMDEYVARDQRVEFACQGDVACCDVYVGLFAWRYGYVPAQDNPERLSVTEMEYSASGAKPMIRLTFLLKDKVRWPGSLRDADPTSSDYKGKIVYVDIWGTWCGPCIQEIPGALKLQEDYKNKPVVFLYVALEYDKNDIAGWRNFIAGKNERFLDKPFTGIHVVAEKQFGNEEIEPYKINYAPTHILIDHKGNIVQARAGRVEIISKDIDQLLAKMNK